VDKKSGENGAKLERCAAERKAHKYISRDTDMQLRLSCILCGFLSRRKLNFYIICTNATQIERIKLKTDIFKTPNAFKNLMLFLRSGSCDDFRSYSAESCIFTWILGWLVVGKSDSDQKHNTQSH